MDWFAQRKYFSDKEAKPLKQGTELVKQIFG